MVEIQHEFVTIEKITFHIASTGPDNGRLILFLHGFPENWLVWKKQLLFFGSKGFKAIAIDQRGYNLTSKPKYIYDYRIDILALDILYLVQYLKRKKVILIGHDWGGNVAWWTALRFPHIIEKLIIINVPHPLVMRKTMKTNYRQMFSSWYIYFFQIPLIPEAILSFRKALLLSRLMTSTANKNTIKKDILFYYRKSWDKKTIHTMINWYRGMKLGSDMKLSSITIKPGTLILWGLMDAFIRPENIIPSKNLCLNSKIVIFRSNTHWIIHEVPDKINKSILNFIQN